MTTTAKTSTTGLMSTRNTVKNHFLKNCLTKDTYPG
jgi:hypothetical protein